MMSCLEFRRRVTAAPAESDPELEAHARACAACAAYRERTREFDRDLLEAMRLEPPEGLGSRILLRQRLDEKARIRARRRRLALAAALLLAVGLGGGLWMWRPGTSLEGVVLAHVNAEMHHLQDQKNLRLAQLNRVLQPLGSTVEREIGPIRYAGSCRIRNHTGGHVVLESSEGPVTVLFMPGEYIDARRPVHDQHFRGVILPTDNGSIAILGESETGVREIERRLVPAVRFES